MHLTNAVAASLCRGALVVLRAQLRRRSAVATALRAYEIDLRS